VTRGRALADAAAAVALLGAQWLAPDIVFALWRLVAFCG
jgi:hypothetical protein